MFSPCYDNIDPRSPLLRNENPKLNKIHAGRFPNNVRILSARKALTLHIIRK